MLAKTISDKYKGEFGHKPQLIVRSPGRINLIGEHTDYNNGFVLPAAIDKAIYFAASPREDDICQFVAYDMGESYTVSLKNISKTTEKSWANYLMGVVAEIQLLRPNILRGINLVFGGDLPNGGGVSSSAAIENGMGFILNTLFDLCLSRLDLVRLSQRAENNFVGMKCGIMDMFASMMGKENSVIRIDCRTLDFDYFPFNNPEYGLVLCDTGIKHALVDSEYNTRRAECEKGFTILQKIDANIKSLRDVKSSFLNKYKSLLSPIVYKRCQYVVKEIKRVETACKALKKNDFEKLGTLMFETHKGLQNDYQVSCPELDFLVEKARHTEGVVGSRMMGGGFGGCSINLVKKEHQAAFIEKIIQAYKDELGLNLKTYQISLTEGTNTISI